MGPAPDRLSATVALFDTGNENVIYIVDAHGGAADLQPGRRAAASRARPCRLVGQITPSLGRDDQLRSTWTPTAGRQNSANDGRRLTLAPEFSGSLWTTVRLPRDIRPRRRPALYGHGVHQHRQHHRRCLRYHRRRRARRGCRSRRQLTLRLNVYNLTDEVYIRSINNNGGRYNPGTPRSFLLSTRSRVLRRETSMLLQVPDVLTPEQVAHARRLLEAAEWVDGTRHRRPPVGHAPSRTCSCPRAARWRASSAT